jgi:hypothetical protein
MRVNGKGTLPFNPAPQQDARDAAEPLARLDCARLWAPR